MLDAAEALLAKADFEKLTVADVVRQSKTSVGVFYSRFRDKDALLDALYERHQQQMIDALESLDPVHWRGVSVPRIVRERIRRLIDLYRDRRGLMRALVIRGHQRPDARYGNPIERRRLFLARFGRLMKDHAAEIRHPDPAQAGSLAMLMVMSTLREKLLFGQSTASALEISEKQLENELVDAVLAYLRATPDV